MGGIESDKYKRMQSSGDIAANPLSPITWTRRIGVVSR